MDFYMIQQIKITLSVNFFNTNNFVKLRKVHKINLDTSFYLIKINIFFVNK